MVTTQIEVFVLVDENADAVATCSQDSLGDLYEEHIGNDPAVARRVVRVVLTVPLPLPAVLTGTVPEEGGAALTAVLTAVE